MNSFASVTAEFVSACVVGVSLVAWMWQERRDLQPGWWFVLAGAILLVAGHLASISSFAGWTGSFLGDGVRLLGGLCAFPLLVFGFWQRSRPPGSQGNRATVAPKVADQAWQDGVRAQAEREQLLFSLDQHAIVTITDDRGHITYVNHKFEEISQYTASELMGGDHRLVRSHVHGDDFFSEMWQTIASGQVWQGEMCNQRKDGTLFWQATTIVPFLNDEGKPYQYIAIRTDISRSKEMEEALRQQQTLLEEEVQNRTRDLQEARDQAIRANRAKSAFLADMSHEIRGPLNVVLGLLELLRRAPLDPQYREYVQLCHSSGRAVLSLLNDTLDFSKIEAGHLTLDRAEFDLRALVDEAALMMAPLAHSKGVELTAFVPRGLHTAVRGDPNRLRQIFVNLLGNAVKFTPRGGVVELHARILGRGDQGTEYHFEVWDTGVGVPVEQRERIFNKFAQVEHQPGQERVEGTGLGLTISKRLVELMGGEIGVEANTSALSGSVFHFSVLLEEVAAVPCEDDQEKLPSLRILVIGSQGLQRVLLDDFFETLGIRYAHVEDSQESRTVLWEAREARDPYRLLMINQKAGGGERSEMVDLQDMLLPGLGIILLTDLLDHGLDQAAHVPGDVLCLQKPISAVRLRGAIDRLLGKGVNQPFFGSAGKSLRELPHTPLQTLYRERILIVDDHMANLKVASGMLQSLGCDPSLVESCADAVTALEKLTQSDYGLVLMDCRMPGMDGLTATRLIRQREAEGKCPRLPVVAFTADILEGKRKDCLEAGMDEILVKPVTLRAMSAMLRKYLQPIPGSEVKLPPPARARRGQEVYSRPGTAALPLPAAPDIPKAMGMFGLPEETFQEVAELIVQQIPDLLVSMGRDVEGQLQEEARAKAHVLRGSMANAIFPSLKEPSQWLHREIRNGDWQRAREALDRLRQEFVPILEALRDYLAQGDTKPAP
ncbi:MAG: response regulator [Magnetococcales bacterium]|nr:response regulator [Magnetococcales bacterium]